MFIDPENKRTKELLKWHANWKGDVNFSSVTGGVGPAAGGALGGPNTNGIGGADRQDNFVLADELIQELA